MARAGTLARTAAEVITPGLLREVFEIEATVLPDPITNAPMVLPIRALGEHPEGEITPETPIDDLVDDSPPELVVA